MIEEKRNYLKEFYDKKENINYEEILTKTNNTNENEIVAIRKHIARLQNMISEENSKLQIELDKSYKSYTPTENNIVLSYNGKSGRVYFDLHSGTTTTYNEETDNCYFLSTKNGEISVVVGYSYENALIIVKRYKYTINSDNTLIRLTPINNYAISFLEPDKIYKLDIKSGYTCLEQYSSSRYALQDTKGSEFISNLYGRPYEGNLSLYHLYECNKSNKSFEIIIKQATKDIIDILLQHRIEETLPIHKIIGVQLDTYRQAVERGIVRDMYIASPYISGDKKDLINKSEYEWLDIVEELKRQQENLDFYGIKYYGWSYDGRKDSLLKLILEYYTSGNIKSYYTLGKYINYVVEETINQGYTNIRDFMVELRDYISMCERLDIKPTLYSSYLKQTHDITSRNYNIKVELEKEDMFKAAYKDFKKWVGDKYVIIAPTETKDLQEEGSRLNHCVASYIKRVIDKECQILFLRDKNNEKESLITIEIRDNKVTQVKGSHNRKPNDNEIEEIVKFAKDRELGVSF